MIDYLLTYQISIIIKQREENILHCIFPIFWQQMEFCLVTNLTENVIKIQIWLYSVRHRSTFLNVKEYATHNRFPIPIIHNG